MNRTSRSSLHGLTLLLAAIAAVAVAVVAGADRALADELPGIISPAEHEALQVEAAEQERAAREAFISRARTLGFGEAEIQRALTPTMDRRGHFDQTLADGTVVRFPWFRIGFAENAISNTERAIARAAGGEAANAETNKGGVRLHKGVFASEVWALALKMDAKLAITGDAANGQAFRGAKGGIGSGTVIKVGSRFNVKVGDLVDPASEAFDRTKIMEGFAGNFRAGGGRVGLGFDIQAGDVNTKAEEMRALSRAFAGAAEHSPGVSGKPVIRLPDGSIDPRGGIAFRAVSTGEGVWMAARLAAASEGLRLDRATVGAQGWGEVGRGFGMAAAREGARLIAIEELWNVGGERVAGTLVHPKGERATAAEVTEWLGQIEEARRTGADLREFRGGSLLGQLRRGVGLSTVKLDIVGFNALGGVLNERSVPELVESGTHQGRRKIIVEGANLAQTVEGAAALDRLRGRLLSVPGELANLGGVHVSNLEAIQNRTGRVITDEEARRSLQETMRSGWDRANALATEHGISVRQAVELLAVEEVMRRSLQRADATRTSLETRFGVEIRRAGPGMADVVVRELTGSEGEREGTTRTVRGTTSSVTTPAGGSTALAPLETAAIAETVRSAFPRAHPLHGEDRVKLRVEAGGPGVDARIIDGAVQLRVSPETLERIATASAGMPEAEATAFRRRALALLSLDAVDRATSAELALDRAGRGAHAFGEAGLTAAELGALTARLRQVGLEVRSSTAERVVARGPSVGRGRGLLGERASNTTLRRLRDRLRTRRRRAR